MEPDFSLLYSELHLPPDCSLEEFKCAYRRRIAELHPDRKRDVPSSPEAEDALATLISTYVAVNRFHSRYGRMPGATSSRPATANGPRSANSASRLPVPAPSTEQPEGPTWRLVIIFAVLLVLLMSLETLAPQ
ncbi:MAG: J domain-containing protein [Pseudoxanthomonas sp.]